MKKNIVLTGLMGSGKTTIGKVLSDALNLPFIDVDEEIEKQYGPISKIFEMGEEHFRNIETKVILNISTIENIVISTGGGVVLREENITALSRNGLIFYLERPIEEILLTLDTSNRPLLKNGTDVLYRIKSDREPLYHKFCDHIIDASNIDKAVSTIIGLWNRVL